MRSLEALKKEREPKHTGVGKTSRPKNQPEISSTSSAFKLIQPGNTVDREITPVAKERGRQEAVKMAADFQNLGKN